MKIRTALLLALLLAPAALPARAETMTYIPDPVYQSFDPAETSPMQDMLDLANSGDVRAQYILGDMYAKGKGGLAKDEKQGAKWFETAAKNGYFEAFIRLAALAKHRDDAVGAYKWYTLALHYMDYGPWRKHADDARDALEKAHKFTSAERDAAHREINEWKTAMRRAREEEKAREAAAAKQRRKELDALQKKQDAAAKKQQEKKP